MNKPIFVVGTGRCGSTWLQEFLNLHPSITIYGQLPNLPIAEVQCWYDRLVAAGEWGRLANENVPGHYVECDQENIRIAFRSMLMRFWTNDLVGRRWGLKLLHVPADPDLVAFLEELWPDAQWITCVRDPFATFESLKNTFRPEMLFSDFLAEWCGCAEFGRDRGRVVRIDRLASMGNYRRTVQLQVLMQSLELDINKKQLGFAIEMPVVHKVKPDDQRTFKLADVVKQQALEDNRFAELFTFFGYRGEADARK